MQKFTGAQVTYALVLLRSCALLFITAEQIQLRKDAMYKIFMLIALPLLAIGWIAYAVWMHKVREEEKKAGKPTSQRLQKTKSEVSDWAKKMAQFQPPTRKKTEDGKQNPD